MVGDNGRQAGRRGAGCGKNGWQPLWSRCDGRGSGPCVTKGLPISKARGWVLSNALNGLDCCHGVSRRCKSRAFWVPLGETSLPSTWLGARRGMGQLMSGRLSVSCDHRRGCCWDSRTPTFTAGFLQRHQILGRSSRAQPASLVVSPVPGGREELLIEVGPGRGSQHRRPGLKTEAAASLSSAGLGAQTSGQLSGQRAEGVRLLWGWRGGLTGQPRESKGPTLFMR